MVKYISLLAEKYIVLHLAILQFALLRDTLFWYNYDYERVNFLPNIKSSILSVKTDAARHAKNVSAKSAIKTASRKVLDAVAAGNAEEAKTLLAAACKKIDQAAANKLFHKNCAARRKSRLARRVNSLSK